MSTSLIIDGCIVAILGLYLYIGWSRGVMHSLLALAGTILAITIASQVSEPASNLIIEQVIRPATHIAVEQHLTEAGLETLFSAPVEEIQNAISTIDNEFVRNKILELLTSLNVPAKILTGAELLTFSLGVVDTVLHGPVQELLSTVIFVLCFALLSLALRPVIWLVGQTFKLPILRQLNQWGGLLSGAVKGILLVLITVWALHHTGILLTDEIIAHSYFLKLAHQCLTAVGLGGASIL